MAHMIKVGATVNSSRATVSKVASLVLCCLKLRLESRFLVCVEDLLRLYSFH